MGLCSCVSTVSGLILVATIAQFAAGISVAGAAPAVVSTEVQWDSQLLDSKNGGSSQSSKTAVLDWYDPHLTMRCADAALNTTNVATGKYGYTANACKDMSKAMRVNCYNAFWHCHLRDVNIPAKLATCYSPPYGVGTLYKGHSIRLWLASYSINCVL